ncbi:MAG: cysteine desulfurase [Candidatus Altiarchaeota archaeon]|nr:cysteine desulfurase [Candidatus Altiarchaeota archaeon]
MNYQNDFPLIKNRGITYFDSGATTLKPQSVIDAVVNFYTHHTANIHRGIHILSEEATELYEESKEKVANFLNTKPENVIYVKNATEGLNFASAMIDFSKGDKVLTSVTEHHSNLLPWLLLKKQGVIVDFVDIDENGKLNMDELVEKAKGAKVMAFSHASNVIGTINPVSEISKIAREVGAISVIDAAQSVPHLPVNFSKLDVDFLAFSGHKMLAPSGTGGLLVKEGFTKTCTPPIAGGGTIEDVTLTDIKWASGAEKFEGGTPNIEGAIGLGAAVDYLQKIGMKNVRRHELELLNRFYSNIQDLPLTTYGPKPNERTGLVTFTLKSRLDGKMDIHAHDIADFLNARKIAVRSGKHCAHPLHYRLNIPASTRASFHVYNTTDEVDALFLALKEVVEAFS